MATQTGKVPKQLEPAEVDAEVLYLWVWFNELSGGRGYSESGPLPITYSEILAWSELTRTDLAAWEVEVLKTLDRAYLNEALKK